MRILTITGFYPPLAVGAYERCCKSVVDALEAEHEVRVLVSRFGAAEVPDTEQVRRRLPLFSGVEGDTVGAPAATLAAQRLIRREVADFRPDLCFVWSGARLPRGALRALELSGVPVAYSVHDMWLDEAYLRDPFTRYLQGRERGVRAIWALAARAVNRLPGLRIDLRTPAPVAICWNSHATRELTHLPASAQIVLERVIYPASDNEELFSGLQRRPDPSPSILCVGRVEQAKGPHVALRALAALEREHGLSAKLVFCGAVEDRTALELTALANELGIADRVEYRGALGPSALSEAFAQAGVLLVPPVGVEGFGLVCVEAALARLPVVASPTGGMAEILADEREALWFAPGDWAGAAAAMARVLREPPAATGARVERARLRAEEFSTRRYLAESVSFVLDAQASLASAAVQASL